MAGRPIWYELMTPDPAAVAPFYKAIVGWDVQGLGTETPSGHPYWMIGRADGGHAGGVILLTEEMQMSGGTAAWIPYFEVDDVAATVETARSGGAQVWLPPMTMDVGTMAMLGDPQGASFYVMDPTPPEGQPDAQSDVFKSKAPGHCWWNELETTDEPGATAFYTALFDWNTEQTMPMPVQSDAAGGVEGGDKGDYRFVAIDGEQIGAINPWMADYMRVGWLPYFGVADIDTAKAQVEANGGTVTHDVHQVPSGGYIFTATDPAGAHVGFVGPKGA